MWSNKSCKPGPFRKLMWAGLLFCSCLPSARADSWNYWGTVFDPVHLTGSLFSQLATDGTNLCYSTLVDGVFRGDLNSGLLMPLPMTGFPLWSPGNTNGLAVESVAVSPQGTLLISGQPIDITTVSNATYITFSPALFPTNAGFYYFDANVNQWQAATITGKDSPYAYYTGKFSIGQDGTIWNFSGYRPYVYRSTDDGRSYTTLDLDELVPTNYLPALNYGAMTFGEVFGVVAAPNHEVFAGTQTGGFLCSKDNGQSWTSLDPDFTDTNSLNPLGRIGDARFGGIDRFGDVLCVADEYFDFPGIDDWEASDLIAYHPADGSYQDAGGGLPPYQNPLPLSILTTLSGQSFTFMNQTPSGIGGVYRSADGSHWTQFNEGIPALDFTPTTNDDSYSVVTGDCIAMSGNQVFVGTGGEAGIDIWMDDATPAPITNHPPSATPQNLTLWQNESTNITLAGTDADGDALNFDLLVQPQWGTLSGTPPDAVYTPGYYYHGVDSFQFAVDDGQATSTVATVSIMVNELGAPAPDVAWLDPAGLITLIGPTNLVASTTATDLSGIQEVDFWDGTNFCGACSAAPFFFNYPDLAAGTHELSALAINNLGGAAWSAPVTVLVVAAPLQVSISATPTNLAVAWPLRVSGALLESATSLCGPWSLEPSPPADLNYSQHSVAVTNQSAAGFFRLFIAP